MLDRARVRDIFSEAASLPAGARAAYLERTCGCDQALRAEVQSLLDAAAGRPEFLASPTAGGADLPAERPGERIGPYKILQEIGQGGFGAVYMAEQDAPVRRRVALKIIKLGMDTRAVIARFEAERQALAMMEHDHIAKVLDAGATESGRPYFVMELVPGDPITVYADRAHLTIAERLELFVQVCRAVQHAHLKGVIHRDLKPGNILVATQDGRPHAKVIDFGIAKAISRRLTERTMFTEFRQFVGTPQYMSPEQAGGGTDVDTRSDVYSLGALLYELLTGVTPFDPETLRGAAYEDVFRIIREEDPAPPSTRCSRAAGAAALRRAKPERLSALLAGDLDWIVMKALEKDRGRRYETAAALAEDVIRHLEGRAVRAAPPSLVYRARKFARRNRGLVVGGSAVAAALLLGVIGTSLALLDAGRARTRAETQAARAEAAEAEALRGRREAEYEAYVASIESAYNALQFNEAGRLRMRLDACRPEHRGWEWRYLDAASDGSVLVLAHPKRQVWRASFNREGSRVVTCSGDGKVRVWDSVTGVELASFTPGERVLGDVEFSGDGSLILCATAAGPIHVWDAESLAEAAVLTGHTSRVRYARFLGSDRVVSGSEDGTVRVWDARSGSQQRLMPHEGAVQDAALSPDSMRLATACDDRRVRIWDLDRATAPLVLKGHDGGVLRVRWSADGARVVSASLDGTARVWDATTGAELARFDHTNSVSYAEFSPDGARVASCAYSGAPQVWDAATGRRLFSLEGHTNLVARARFSRDGRWLLTNSFDTTARLWDASTGEERSRLRGHVETPFIAEFAPDGEHILTAGDATARLWRIRLDATQSLIVSPRPDPTAVHLSSDLATIFEAGDGRVRLLDVASGRETVLDSTVARAGGGALSPDGSRAFAAFEDGVIHSWDVRSGRPGPLFKGHRGLVNWMEVSADGARVVTAGIDGTTRVWDAATGNQELRLDAPNASATSCAFDRKGERVVTGEGLGDIRIWDARSGERLLAFHAHENQVLSVQFSADGARILSTSNDTSARVWDAAGGRELLALRGHEHVVKHGAFSPDGARIATCSTDGTLRLWDASTGRQVLSVRGPGGGALESVQFTNDGTRLFLADAEGRAYLLDSVPPRQREIRSGRAPAGEAMVTERNP